MKHDLPFFSHDNNARNHPKFQALLAQYGAAGYGQFWMLNEMISQAEDARLDLSKKVNKGAVARGLGMDYAEFDLFLAFISDPEIDLVNLEDGILTTDRTQEDYSQVKSERERKKDKYQALANSPGKKALSPGRIDLSPGRIDTEQSRAEQSRAEREELASAPVDNFSGRPPEETASLHEFALKLAATKKPKNVEALALKLEGEPDVIEKWEASRPKPKIRKPAIPEPTDCPICHARITKFDTYEGSARCSTPGCVDLYWDKTLKSWEVEDLPQEGTG